MNATISMDSLWRMIQTLPLNNRKWLSAKLQESVADEQGSNSQKVIADGIRDGLVQSMVARRNGQQMQTLQDFIDEHWNNN